MAASGPARLIPLLLDRPAPRFSNRRPVLAGLGNAWVPELAAEILSIMLAWERRHGWILKATLRKMGDLMGDLVAAGPAVLTADKLVNRAWLSLEQAHALCSGAAPDAAAVRLLRRIRRMQAAAIELPPAPPLAGGLGTADAVCRLVAGTDDGGAQPLIWFPAGCGAPAGLHVPAGTDIASMTAAARAILEAAVTRLTGGPDTPGALLAVLAIGEALHELENCP